MVEPMNKQITVTLTEEEGREYLNDGNAAWPKISQQIIDQLYRSALQSEQKPVEPKCKRCGGKGMLNLRHALDRSEWIADECPDCEPVAPPAPAKAKPVWDNRGVPPTVWIQPQDMKAWYDPAVDTWYKEASRDKICDGDEVAKWTYIQPNKPVAPPAPDQSEGGVVHPISWKDIAVKFLNESNEYKKELEEVNGYYTKLKRAFLAMYREFHKNDPPPEPISETGKAEYEAKMREVKV